MLDERLCDHGCGRVARFVNKSERHVCEKSSNKCPSVRKRNSEGLKKAHSEGRVPSPSSEMRERSVLSKQREAIERKFVKGSKSSGAWIKEMLFKHFGWEEKCKECGQSNIHNGKHLTLQLDHINGDSADNRIENLKLLCPNCHSQTETFCGRGNTGNIKVDDETLLEALKTTKNIRQALLKVGLTARGKNYERCHRLKEECGLL
jgi:5-methylcytosine-specific restriction endonuclease McrA